MGREFSALKYIKLIFLIPGFEDGNSVVSFENYKDFADDFTISEIANHNGVTGSEYVESMRFIIEPLSVNIFSVRNVYQSLAIQEILAPMRDVE